MTALNCLIVDDEPLAHGVIENYAARLPHLKIVASCLNTASAHEVLDHQEIDLMFLDIQLPRMTGTTFLDKLPDPPLAILTTAHEDYAIQGYDLDVVDYLLKPFEFDRFEQAIAKAEVRFQASTPSLPPPPPKQDESQTLLVRTEGSTLRVPIAYICYIQAMGDYTNLKLRNGRTLCCHRSLTQWEKILPEEGFMRIHRSYIISLDCVDEVTANQNIIIDDNRIPVGRTYLRKFKTSLQKFYRG
ncbi:LytTR family DNA-binding domain-containing protein [Kiritimatiellaeota bacterium B1221]|nr:LytTR family DNA-binding domain-containing protein [Kiritimatiellaeota bacterium B1221]